MIWEWKCDVNLLGYRTHNIYNASYPKGRTHIDRHTQMQTCNPYTQRDAKILKHSKQPRKHVHKVWPHHPGWSHHPGWQTGEHLSRVMGEWHVLSLLFSFLPFFRLSLVTLVLGTLFVLLIFAFLAAMSTMPAPFSKLKTTHKHVFIFSFGCPALDL